MADLQFKTTHFGDVQIKITCSLCSQSLVGAVTENVVQSSNTSNTKFWP